MWIFMPNWMFTQKAWFVAEWHMKASTSSLRYSSVVSQESIRIAHTVAALNDLEVLVAMLVLYIFIQITKEMSVQLQVKNLGLMQDNKLLWIKPCMVWKVQVLHEERIWLPPWMTNLSIKPCQDDQDTWMQQQALKPDGMNYYEYVLSNVDDILVLLNRASTIMENLSALYSSKENASKC
jgi:hypothetical protein